MKTIYIIEVGEYDSSVYTYAVFDSKNKAIKALKENGYKWMRNCYIKDIEHSHLRCAKIGAFELNEF